MTVTQSILHLLLTQEGWEVADQCYRYPLQHGAYATLTDATGLTVPAKANAPCVLRFFDPDRLAVLMLRCSDVQTAMDVVVAAVVYPDP